MTLLTLTEASLASRVSRSGLRKAITTGRLSATKTDDGEYRIDPAELFRVYPKKGGGSVLTHALRDAKTGKNAGIIEELESELQSVKAERDALANQVDIIKDERDHLRRTTEQDAEERRRLTRLLTDQSQKPEPTPPSQTPVWIAIGLGAISLAAVAGLVVWMVTKQPIG